MFFTGSNQVYWRIRYEASGDESAPPVVLLHGIGRSLEDWSLQHPLLSGDHRVISLDLPGFGLSPRMPGTASLTGTPDGVVAHTGGGSGGTIDLAVTADERFLYVENSFAGTVEGYRIHADHTLELVSTATGLPRFDGHGMEGLVAL